MATMLYQGHGSYRFVLDDATVIYVDPFAGEGYNLPADLILSTHEHFDHTAFDKMPHAPNCSIIRAADLHPSPSVYDTREDHGVVITAVQAYNDNHSVDECVGYLLYFDGITFYASGDTSCTDDMESGRLKMLDIDYAVFPCDGFYNMDRVEASRCAELVGAKHSIPIHMVPMDNPSNPSQLFDARRAEEFHAEGRIILAAGESIVLVK
ncbi:MAG: MBL fold metallo-hydrolase [Eggerthellaceae bacterium]|nr:MBL fold metallo-hydrolase [Eggerthellaceae bacterium]